MFREIRGDARVSRLPRGRVLGSSECCTGVNSQARIEFRVQESTEMG